MKKDHPLYMVIILTFIASLSCGILAAVNSFTKPKIQEAQAKEELAALKKLFPEAAEFNDISSDNPSVIWVKEAVASDGSVLGCCVNSFQKGYSSDIVLLTAIDGKGSITGIQVMAQSETPGLGTRIEESGFLGQYTGKALPDVESGTGIDAISGATISSEAFRRAVIAALKSAS